MFEGFTLDARAVIDASQVEAAGLGLDSAGSEHLLLALAAAKVGISAAVLADVGISEAQVRQAVASATERGSAKVWDGRHRWTMSAKRLLEISLREMLKRDAPGIEPEHMLLAAAQVKPGRASEILARFGVEVDQIEARVTDRR